jgi:predicted membrane-bound spermidine synthase
MSAPGAPRDDRPQSAGSTPAAAAPDYRRALLFALFTLSGFAGLIYESIWSHYLKLFLGHAAYAQTLVLALFMGGMALGAWLASRLSARWRNLLRGYAIVEALIGIAAIAFHSVFVATTDAAYGSLLPAVGSDTGAALVKWSLAAALVLPQSVLLGMTFPLMSAGLLRRHPERPGEALAMLYFTNSFGAAVGVLASGFVLIDGLGLPGTIQLAGALNLALAVIVWLIAPGRDPDPAQVAAAAIAARTAAGGAAASWRLLLAVAALTGAASFIYEIGWIRMLTLVLGAATHSFELMLSAFILGLAAGGYWVRRRIDRAAEPLALLGLVQVAMGLAALATLPLYGAMFDVMQLVIQGTAKTDAGYGIFLFASHGIALAIMFPATFCAGMTLPLITYALLARGHGERAIGGVYAANTLGAIAGVVFAAHVGMPWLGLKGLITAGAALDLALGLLLLWRLAVAGYLEPRGAPLLPSGVTLGATAVALAALLGVGLTVSLDPYKMASGVFRRGDLYSASDAELKFYRDGKTTSVSLMQFSEGLSLRTNGKSDGAINLGEGPRISDEVTMVLTAALPLAHKPDARTAAIIGIGTGLTSHTMLASPALEHVDTIEIEPAMAEAARGFSARNASVFADPRSRIVFDDAKTYFSTHNRRYDIIVSEPSNPWVSGVASLFTTEFYRHVRRYLNPGGVMVQWFQLYEIDMHLVASVLQALGENFPDYAIYAATDSDLLIVAADPETLARPLHDVFQIPGLADELRKVHVQRIGDLDVRRLGGRSSLHPLFLSYGTPANSDFRPYLDLNAAKYRFLQRGAGELTRVGADGVPIIAMLESRRHAARPLSYDGDEFLDRIELARRARYARDYYLDAKLPLSVAIPAELEKNLELSKLRGLDCIGEAPDIWVHALFQVARTVNSALPPAEADAIWAQFERAPCYRRLARDEQAWVKLLRAVGARDAAAMARHADDLLGAGRELTAANRQFLLTASLVGNILSARLDRAQAAWDRHSAEVVRRELGIDLRLLYAYLAVAKSVADRPS